MNKVYRRFWIVSLVLLLVGGHVPMKCCFTVVSFNEQGVAAAAERVGVDWQLIPA